MIILVNAYLFILRDLKPENLLFESNNEGSPLKVIDFGTSRVFDPTHKMDQKFGTVELFISYFQKALLHCS